MVQMVGIELLVLVILFGPVVRLVWLGRKLKNGTIGLDAGLRRTAGITGFLVLAVTVILFWGLAFYVIGFAWGQGAQYVLIYAMRWMALLWGFAELLMFFGICRDQHARRYVPIAGCRLILFMTVLMGWLLFSVISSNIPIRSEAVYPQDIMPVIVGLLMVLQFFGLLYRRPVARRTGIALFAGFAAYLLVEVVKTAWAGHTELFRHLAAFLLQIGLGAAYLQAARYLHRKDVREAWTQRLDMEAVEAAVELVKAPSPETGAEAVMEDPDLDETDEEEPVRWPRRAFNGWVVLVLPVAVLTLLLAYTSLQDAYQTKNAMEQWTANQIAEEKKKLEECIAPAPGRRYNARVAAGQSAMCQLRSPRFRAEIYQAKQQGRAVTRATIGFGLLAMPGLLILMAAMYSGMGGEVRSLQGDFVLERYMRIYFAGLAVVSAVLLLFMLAPAFALGFTAYAGGTLIVAFFGYMVWSRFSVATEHAREVV